MEAHGQANDENILELNMETGEINYQSWNELAEIGVLPYESAYIGKMARESLDEGKNGFCYKYQLKRKTIKDGVQKVSICSARSASIKY
jgi:hypothetical protein